MKIALGQLNIQAGNIDANLESMKQMVMDAKAQGAALIIFPEMAVSGYLLGDKLLQRGFVDRLMDCNEMIKSWSTDIGIIWGNISHNEGAKANRDGRFNRMNSAYFAYQNEWVEKANGSNPGLYHKHCLPDYRFFDDSRIFKSGVEVSLENNQATDHGIVPFIFKHHNETVRIGLEVCEDLWSKDYNIDPTSLYIQKGVDFIINISSSPWTLNKEQSRVKRIQEHVSFHQDKMVPIIYVNAAGMQNNGKNVLVFDGDSTIYGKDGKIQAECPDNFEQYLGVFDLHEQYPQAVQKDKLLNALVHAIREFDKQLLKGKTPWIIGLSGGLDSSVNAALLVLALGKHRVIGYNMASRYNQAKTKSIAAESAERLGIEYHEGSIEALVQSTVDTLKDYDIDAVEGLAFENIQARIRGHLLSSFASYKGGVICNNGNKVECALGYATLYGDTIGALSPLGDCTKMDLFHLAKRLNEVFGSEVISNDLIPTIEDNTIHFGLPPSAELRTNQLDPMKWVYHDWLVQYFTQYPSHHLLEWLEIYASNQWQSLEIAPWIRYYQLDDPKNFVEDIQWFTKAWHFAVFKRIQFPPIVTVSRGSFGYDYRESQLPYVNDQAVEVLIERILAKEKQS
ncbi:MAG TPA: NAD(+) synthase [Erysipelotrichaceae bacterium]|nr:NAD(+) synthase [Erysipelotrichaceae bacterium]